eukprot:5363571-Pleurochrysis_carterae.AAC.8
MKQTEKASIKVQVYPQNCLWETKLSGTMKGKVQLKQSKIKSHKTHEPVQSQLDADFKRPSSVRDLDIGVNAF